MKFLYTILCLFFVGTSVAQTYPVPQNVARTPNTILQTNFLKPDQGIVPGIFVDTAAANALPYLKNYPGALIFTTSDTMLRIRSVDASVWLAIPNLGRGGGGGTPTDSIYWRVSGNGQIILNSLGFGGIGSANAIPVGFVTSGLPRMIVPAAGIQRQSSPIYKALLYDTVNKSLGFSEGATFGDDNFWYDRNLYTPIVFSNNSFTDSTLLSVLSGTTTSYFNDGLILKNLTSGGITSSFMRAWNYGMQINENWSQRLLFQVLDSATALTIGIGVEGDGVINQTNNISYINGVLGDSAATVLLNTQTTTGTPTQTTGVLINVGDVVELTLTQNLDSAILFYRNLTNNNSYKLVRQVSSTLTGSSVRMGYPTIYFSSGHVKLIDFSLANQEYDYHFIGNSIAYGHNASSLDTGHISLLKRKTNARVNIAAHSAAVTPDFLNTKNQLNFSNKIVFLDGLMGNDFQAGYTAAQAKDFYATLVSRLRANGNTIVHIPVTYRTLFMGSATWTDMYHLNQWLDTAYGAIDKVVQLDSLTAAMLSDGLHPNDAGHTSMYNSIYRACPEYFSFNNPYSITASEGLIKVGNDIQLDDGSNPLTRNVSIDADGNDFIVGAAGTLGLGATSQINLSGSQGASVIMESVQSGGWNSSIYLRRDSLMLAPLLGRLNIDTIRNLQAANDSMLTWNPTSGVVSRRAIPSGGGVATLAAIGASPNANGATISGTTLNLEPASASFGGVMTTGGQTFAGAKYFSNQVRMNVGSVGTPGLTFDSDLNSGFYSVADGTLSYSKNGTTSWIAAANTGTTPATALRLDDNTMLSWSSDPDNVAEDIWIYRSSANKMGFHATNAFFDGNLGVGNVTSPTAKFHLPAGTATANTAPIKFTSGTNLTSAEAGAMEWDGTNLFITQTSGPTRKTLAYTTDITLQGAITGSAILTQNNVIDANNFDFAIDNIGQLNITTSNGSIFNGDVGVVGNTTLSASLNLAYATTATNLTLNATHQTVNVSAAATITLPTAVSITGREYTIVNSHSANITLNTTSSQTIGLNTTSTSVNIAADGGITVISDGANWKIKNQF